jgi:hypothetical protein
MLPFRQTVAVLVVVAVFTSAAAVPRPEEAKKEADNIIPQVGCDSLTHTLIHSLGGPRSGGS